MSKDVMKLVDAPELAGYDTVEVCGNQHEVKEFSMAERHLWVKVRDESGLDDMIEDFTKLQRQVEEFDEAGLSDVYLKRAAKIDEEVSEIVEKTSSADWNDKLEVKLNGMLEEAKKFRLKARDLLDPKRKEVAKRSPELTAKLEELNERQARIFLTMTWKLAKLHLGEKREFEDYFQAATGLDRIAAQEVVEEGNFTWEARSLNRSQRRALLKNRIPSQG